MGTSSSKEHRLAGACRETGHKDGNWFQEQTLRGTIKIGKDQPTGPPCTKIERVTTYIRIKYFYYTKTFQSKKRSLSDITRQVSILWKHKENAFNEFKSQYLIPHMESTRGPRLAVADVNGDGLDDFFVCGAKDQSGCLFIQQQNGGFKKSDSLIFKNAIGSEEVDGPQAIAHENSRGILFGCGNGVFQVEDGRIRPVETRVDEVLRIHGAGGIDQATFGLVEVVIREGTRHRVHVRMTSHAALQAHTAVTTRGAGHVLADAIRSSAGGQMTRNSEVFLAGVCARHLVYQLAQAGFVIMRRPG